MDKSRLSGQISVGVAVLIFLAVVWMTQGCVTTKLPTQPPPQRVEITVNGTDATPEVAPDVTPEVSRSMSVDNTDLQLSNKTRIHNNIAYMEMTGVNSWNAKDLWADMKLLETMAVDKVVVFLNNYGGQAVQGCSLSDEFRIFKKSGIPVVMEGRGIIASAAIPIFLSGDVRKASKNTVFMVHPASVFKWGQFTEGLKELQEQADMIKMQTERYAIIVSENSTLSKDDVMELMKKTTWFTAEQAKEMGWLHEIQ